MMNQAADGVVTFRGGRWRSDPVSLGSSDAAGAGRSSQLRGELRLVLAVLMEAINSYCEESFVPGGGIGEDHQRADAWIFTNNRSWPFSFVNICEALGLNPGYVRRNLLEWKRRNMACRKHRKWRHLKLNSGQVK